MSQHGTAYTLGQYSEVLAAMVRTLPKALEGTDPKKLIAGLQKNGERMEGLLGEVLRSIQHSPIFARDMREEGWTLVEHAPRRIISVDDLELVPFPKADESSIGGEELILRARGELNANYGQEDAEWLLEHQEEIPKEFRNFYLVFTATVWQDSGGDRDVAYLDWDGLRWCLYFAWLGSGFGDDARLVRPRK